MKKLMHFSTLKLSGSEAFGSVYDEAATIKSAHGSLMRLSTSKYLRLMLRFYEVMWNQIGTEVELKFTFQTLRASYKMSLTYP